MLSHHRQRHVFWWTFLVPLVLAGVILAALLARRSDLSEPDRPETESRSTDRGTHSP